MLQQHCPSSNCHENTQEFTGVTLFFDRVGYSHKTWNKIGFQHNVLARKRNCAQIADVKLTHALPEKNHDLRVICPNSKT
jgi:hypothetical protein